MSIENSFDRNNLETNVDAILCNVERANIIKRVFIDVYDYVVKLSLCGECYSISAVLYIILNELGLRPLIFLGTCKYKNQSIRPFYHSWVVLYDRIIDIACMYQLSVDKVYEPLLLSKTVFTHRHPDIVYGIQNNNFDMQYFEMKSCTVTDCINNHTEFMWDFVYSVISDFGISANIRQLKRRYDKVCRICI